MIPIPVNKSKRKVIRRKIVRNTINMKRQTHCRAILIRPTAVTIDASNVKRRATKKGSDKIMRTLNVKVADDSI